ncbi:AraC family transcriptional regulator [Bradyrhizobium sp. ARR65]|uniref:AraC family transcriptional regulator n=1 Tax=Bradyrhizobium sp. ARR65 TaxID=1040989 RepID=UPI00046703FD|nr:AraC family transcriptional regulator [Bradyrhizobium sp. ARR65]
MAKDAMTQSIFFSTAGMEGQQSVGAWRQAMAEVYCRLDIQSAHADRVRGEIRAWQSDVLGVSNIRADAYRIIRRREAAKADKTENFIFSFPTRQGRRFEQRGRECLVPPGGVFILNAAEPYVVDVPDAAESITLKVNRERLAGRIAGIDDLCASADFTSPLLAPAITTLGEQVLKLQPTEHTARIEDSIIDLLCLMIECHDQGDTGALIRQTLGTSLFNRVNAYIRRNFADHSLTPDRVAADHRISVRYLHKIFHFHGTTFGQVLREERLRQAHQLIIGSRHHGTTNFGEVAYRCGFGSQSHFSVSYKNRFGISPRRTLLAAE